MKIEKYAAIDIGSNGVRLLICNVFQVGKKTEFVKSILVRAPVRLGADSFKNNEIEPKTIEMLCEAMKSFASLMKCYEVKYHVACATSALREASNQNEVLKIVKDASGIDIHIIDGSKEAEIIYHTQVKEVIKDDRGYLFIDVGGGSTELTFYKNRKAVTSQSFKIGSVRALQGLVEDSEWIRVKDYLKTISFDSDSVAIGTGGNINSLFKRSQKALGKPLTTKYLTEIYSKLEKMTFDERIIEYKFNPDRADVIIYAIEIYIEVLKLAKIKEIFVPKIGLADGLIQNLYQRNQIKQ